MMLELKMFKFALFVVVLAMSLAKSRGYDAGIVLLWAYFSFLPNSESFGDQVDYGGFDI